VAAARLRQAARQEMLNAALAGDALDRHAAVDAAGSAFLQAVAARLGWSARGFHRVLRVARSIADLAGEERVATAHLAEAVQYRRLLGLG
jgi:magnesium chelatase family protein